MIISALYRKNDLLGDTRTPSSRDNPGGGVVSKVYHLQEALPKTHLTNNIEEAGPICIAEALWFTEEGDLEKTEQRVDAFAKLNALKILWLSDVEVLRMQGYLREQLFDAADAIGTLSLYSQKLTEAYTNKATLLYDPLDIDMFKPGAKHRELFGIGHISLEKNIESLANIFGAIPAESELTTTYIGSRNTWGLNHRDTHSQLLETELYESCDNLETQLPRHEIARRMAGYWGYLGDTRYDFSSYSMMEAMLCGCWLFCGRHLMYNERPCIRFSTTEEAVELIVAQLETHPPESGVVNEAARQFIVERNSYDAFRSQLKNIIGGISIGL